MNVLRALAPAKINLGLWLGPSRAADGRHEIASVMQSISLADELTLQRAPAAAGTDELVCPGVAGPVQENLCALALRSFRRATGWDQGPLHLSVVKRIPVAAGLGGGSADAAAALRLLQRASGLGDENLLRELAQALGADVPAQVSPGRWLASGAGERLERLPDPSPPLELLLLPLQVALATAAVYAEADRLRLGRARQELDERLAQMRAALALGAPAPTARELLQNDLQPAAVSLCPQVARVLEQARDAGSPEALLSGSGPTVVALFPPPGGSRQAARVAAALAGREPAPIRARSVGAEFGRPQSLGAPGAARRGART